LGGEGLLRGGDRGYNLGAGDKDMVTCALFTQTSARQKDNRITMKKPEKNRKGVTRKRGRDKVTV